MTLISAESGAARADDVDKAMASKSPDGKTLTGRL
jgi:hypothetical protein